MIHPTDLESWKAHQTTRALMEVLKYRRQEVLEILGQRLIYREEDTAHSNRACGIIEVIDSILTCEVFDQFKDDEEEDIEDAE